MSLSELLRGFFGLPGGRRPRDPFLGGVTRDEEEEEDPRFGDVAAEWRFHGDPRSEQLLGDFHQLFQLPSLAPPTSPPPPGERKRTLRDSMLKFPDHPRRSPEGTDPEGSSVPGKRPWRPFHQPEEPWPVPPAVRDAAKEDQDLDSHVFSEGLETILPPTQPRSYFKSVSVTRVVAADGRVEERRTVRDSQGHEETVVTRHTSPGAVEEGQGGPEEGGPALLRRPQNGHLGSDSSSILEAFFQRWFSSR